MDYQRPRRVRFRINATLGKDKNGYEKMSDCGLSCCLGFLLSCERSSSPNVCNRIYIRRMDSQKIIVLLIVCFGSLTCWKMLSFSTPFIFWKFWTMIRNNFAILNGCLRSKHFVELNIQYRILFSLNRINVN